MRNKLIELINFHEKKNSFFLTADMGFSVLEKTQEIFKDFFLNVGIAENNMLLIATGLEQSLQKRIYCYSISNFITLRTLEVIRNYLCNEKRNIRIIGIGPGVSYAEMGKTHFNLEDINIIYSLKNILILNPSNISELNFLYKRFLNYKLPIYFRITKFDFVNNFKLKRYGNLFVKKGKSTNLIISGGVMDHVLNNLSSREISKLNIISVPILDHKYNKNLLSLINKGQKTIFICDSTKTLFFEEIKSSINSKKKIINFDCNHNKIQKVGNYKYILNALGLDRKGLLKLLF